MTSFQKSEFEIVKSAEYLFASNFKSPLRYAGGLKSVPSTMDAPEIMMTGNGKSVQEVADMYNEYFLRHWNEYISAVI